MANPGIYTAQPCRQTLHTHFCVLFLHVLAICPQHFDHNGPHTRSVTYNYTPSLLHNNPKIVVLVLKLLLTLMQEVSEARKTTYELIIPFSVETESKRSKVNDIANRRFIYDLCMLIASKLRLTVSGI